MKNCAQCKNDFDFSDADRAFLKKITPEFDDKPFEIPAPALCPACRQQRRLAFYNRRRLYKRQCDFSKKDIVSIYSSDKPFKVYDKEIWYSDKWNPLDYGRDFDFSRPFFPQFRELMESVPLLSLILLGNNLNSDYNNDNMNLKNCYLLFDGTNGEDSLYGSSFVGIKDSMDFLFMEASELCYETTNCQNCYNLKYSRFCKGCYDSWFLRDCVGCKNCFGCANLNQKEYYIFNEPKTKEEYAAFMKNFESADGAKLNEMRKQVEAFYLGKPVKATHGIFNENVVGDNLNHCKNAYFCFDSNYLEDCEYVSDSQCGAKDSWDVDVWGEGMELCYDTCLTGANVQRVMWCYGITEGARDAYYSMLCSRNVHHLFGCIGLRHKEYCVFNKQYAAEDYEKLVARIAAHMKETGEWGVYFPTTISPFGYNETLAQDHYPMEKEDVLARGWQWRDKPETIPGVNRTIPAGRLPDKTADIPDDILNWALICEETGRPYRLVEEELKFYRKHQLPVPHFHPDERHRRRMALRNPHKLWERHCAKCRAVIETSYAPDRKEIVYCEKCYLEAVR